MILRLTRLLGLLAILTSCSSSPNPQRVGDLSRTFRASYETVWRATQQALLNYPMNINNMDTGQLQTLYITGKHRFKPPHKKSVRLPSGYQYRLNLTIVKGESRQKVIVSKQVRLQKDFFSPPKELGTDGYEEKALLYRIHREILIEKVLKRQAKRKKESN